MFANREFHIAKAKEHEAWTNTACGVFVSSDSNSGVVACVEVESVPAFALLTGLTASSQIESERRTAELARKLSEIESNSTARMTEVDARFKTEEEKQNKAEAEAAKREAEYLREQQVVSVKSGELHQWNLNNGRAIQASYVSATATVVTLKQDGQLFNLRIADLSDADQKLVESCRR